MITKSDESKFLFLIVNATVLVIISTRQRVADAAVITSSFTALRPHQQVLGSPTPDQQQQPTNEQNNFRPPQMTSVTSNNTSSSSSLSHLATITTTTTQSGDTGQSGRLIGANTALETNALAYLQRYGYMQVPTSSETSNNLISEESFSSAIAEFQRFAGLPETGQVDNQTLTLMQAPRCGNTDKPTMLTISKSGQLINGVWASPLSNGRDFSSTPSSSSWSALRPKRRKRYALQGSKWRRQELTYRISQYPTKFAGRRHEVDSQIEKAFGIWSQVAPIDFIVKKEGRVHIEIRFASGDHGDGDAFDGPGNTLAHAYFPQYGGDAHFDDQEYWTVDSYAGTNIFQVAAHELGHSLGLGHSNVREALMAPFYQKYKPNFKLHIDDVLAIQALYGEKAFLPEVPGDQMTTTSQRPAAVSTPSPTPASTTTTPIRTSSSSLGPRSPPIYRGNKRPPVDRNDGEEPPTEPNFGSRDENGNPDLSSNGINGFGSTERSEGETGQDESNLGGGGGATLPADLCSDSVIDAITRTEDGNSYVFKGEHYWQLTNEGLARGYPRRISADWEGLPGHLDAALTWADGKTFFFKGNKYWRFRNRRRDFGYPKLISAGFAGIPDDIDAAFVWSGNGRTYFFKGADYWRFDSKAEPPVSSEYPRSIKVWLGVPAHINAAFKWDNNVTYFFKGNQYYRFNDREFKVETRGRPPFPRQTSEWWFGCVDSNLAQRALPAQPVLLAGGQMRSLATDARHQLFAQQHNSRTARFHPNSFQQRAGATMALQTIAAASGSHQDQADWSFLAGLSADQTRSMGTHISDHHKPPTGQAQGPDRNWREEETFSEPDLDHRLALAPPGRHREPQYESREQTETARRKTPISAGGGDAKEQTSDTHHRTRFELAGSSSSGNGPPYQTSSATTAILLPVTHKHGNDGPAPWSDSANLGRWLSVLCATMIIWLSTIAKRRTIESYGKGYEITCR